MAGRFGAFIIGGAIGAGAALLCAKRAGNETRAVINAKANEIISAVKTAVPGSSRSGDDQPGYQSVDAQGEPIPNAESAAPAGSQGFVSQAVSAGAAFAGEAFSKGSAFAQSAVSRAQGAAEKMTPAFSEKGDELRAKIEEARARIAAQVAKNAEAAMNMANDVVPVAAAAVQDAVNQAASALGAEAEKPVEAVIETVEDVTPATVTNENAQA